MVDRLSTLFKNETIASFIAMFLHSHADVWTIHFSFKACKDYFLENFRGLIIHSIVKDAIGL